MRRPTSSASTPAGVASSRIDTESRTIDHELPRISTPIAIPATGSARSQPVVSTTSAATATPTEPARSAKTCRSAARTLRLSPARERMPAASALTASPISATASIQPPRISRGLSSRWTASMKTQIAITASATPFASAARISARR